MTNNDSFPSRSEINEWITEIKASEKVKHYGFHGESGWFLSYDEISLLVQKAANRELDGYDRDGFAPDLLRDCRRPKAPTREQALTALNAIASGANDTREQYQDFETIRDALYRLPPDA